MVSFAMSDIEGGKKPTSFKFSMCFCTEFWYVSDDDADWIKDGEEFWEDHFEGKLKSSVNGYLEKRVLT